MFKIGEFARLNRVSIRTLRHYEKLCLLMPDYVDDQSGYRYYSATQISRLNRILLLKEIGFSLSEIVIALRDDLTAAQMMDYLTDKRRQLVRVIQSEQCKLERIDARLKILQQEEKHMNYDVIVKELPASNVASLRRNISDYGAQGPLREELTA